MGKDGIIPCSLKERTSSAVKNVGDGDNLLVVEPDYLPDSEVLAFSRVYTP
jgi:hypothetical protein